MREIVVNPKIHSRRFLSFAGPSVTEVFFGDAKSMSGAAYNPVAPVLANGIGRAIGVRPMHTALDNDA